MFFLCFSKYYYVIDVYSFPISPLNALSIILWNVAGAFLSPKGLNYYIYSVLEILRKLCIYLILRALVFDGIQHLYRAEKNFACPHWSSISSITGNGYAFWSAFWSTCLKSITILNWLHFLGTIQIDELKGDCVCLIIPFSSSSLVWSKTNSLCASGSLCVLRLMILPLFNMISCSVRLVHESGSPFSVNTSWYCKKIFFTLFPNFRFYVFKV